MDPNISSLARQSIVDLSHYNDHVDFPKLNLANVKATILKATEMKNGVRHEDDRFEARRDELKARGMRWGAYHFFHDNVEPMAQADFLLSKAEGSDLPLAIDFEKTDGAGKALGTERAQIFLDEIEKVTGRIPLFYGGSSFLSDLNLPASFTRYPLWLAQYTTKAIKIPRPWTTFTIWQYDEHGRVDGVSGDVDMNWFNGSMDALNAFCGPVLKKP